MNYSKFMNFFNHFNHINHFIQDFEFVSLIKNSKIINYDFLNLFHQFLTNYTLNSYLSNNTFNMNIKNEFSQLILIPIKITKDINIQSSKYRKLY